MAETSRYPVVTDVKTTDQFLTWRSSDGQIVKVPWSVILSQLPVKFTSLTDVPRSYFGQVGKTLAVNTAEDGLEFVANTLSPTFQTLPDTPANYLGNGGLTLKVNPTETGVEYEASTFLEESDTPASYSGFAGQIVAVNPGETALEFIPNEIVIPNVVLVDEETDLPTVNGAGEHELAANTAYWFLKPITLANPIRFISDTSVMYGNSSNQTIITYTGIGYAVRGDSNTVISLRNIRIDSSADGIQLTSGGGAGTADSIVLDTVAVFAPSGRVMSVDNPDQLLIDGCFLLGADGILLSGATASLMSLRRSVVQLTATNTVIDFGTSIFDVIAIDSCSLVGPTGATAISGLATNGNISATGSGRVTSNTVAQGLIALSGITTADTKWRFMNNVRIEDSSTIAFAYITTPATTVITAPATVTPIAGTWTAAAVTERATVSTSGVITFNNVEQEKGAVSVTFTAVKLGGGTGSYTFKVQKDEGAGFVDVEAIEKTVTLSPTVASITLLGADKYTATDDFRLIVIGNATSDDIDVAVTQFVIG